MFCSETKCNTLEVPNNKTTTINGMEGEYCCRRTRNLYWSTHFDFVFKTKKLCRVQMKCACRTSFCSNEYWREWYVTASGHETNFAWGSELIICLEVCFLFRKTRKTNMTYNCIFLSWNKKTLLQNNSTVLCDTSSFLRIVKTTDG